jgi:mRNA interferase HigB
MTIHLIRKDTIELYSIQNAQSRDAFEEWMSKLKNADWETSSDMKSTFPSVGLLGNGSSRAVFDIGGNKYRLIEVYIW